MNLKRLVAEAKRPDPADELSMLRAALLAIDQDLRWYFMCSGAINRDEMVSTIGNVKTRVDSVRAIIYGPDGDDDVL